MNERAYERATIRDYGSLVDLTKATGLFGTEDGMSKLVPTHHVPVPSAPAAP